MDFRILGPLEVADGDCVLPLGGAKQRSLLALLLLHPNEVVSTDRLVDDLWGERPPETAAKTVQVYVSRLRKELGEQRIETRGHGYLLRVMDGELDLRRFQTLVERAERERSDRAAPTLLEALVLFRGEPLQDLAFEPWAQAEIARLGDLRTTAFEARIDAELALGRHRQLVPELEARVREQPLRERVRGQLMLALYRSGRQADALEVFRLGRALLDEQLGLEPGPELRELEQRMLQQDPSLAAPPAPLVERASRRCGLLLVLGGAALLLAGAVAAAVVELKGSGDNGKIVRVAPESVGVLNSRTGRIVGQVPVPGHPSLVALDGRVAWVASDASRTIVPVSLDDLSVGRTVVPGLTPTDLAAAAGVVWIVDATRRELVRIDGTYGSVTARIPLPPPFHARKVGQISLAVGHGAVWVTDGSSGLLRLNPSTGHVAASFDLGKPLNDVAVGTSAVWAISSDAAVVFAVDARSGRVRAPIRIVARPGLTKPVPVAITVGEGAVWVLNGNVASVTRIDPKFEAPVQTIPLGAGRAPSSIAAGGGAVWVANSGDGTVVRIDARTNVPRSIDVGSAPIGVAAGNQRVFVSVQPGFAATSTSPGSSTIASVAGALPLGFCSPVYFGVKGTPRFLIAFDLPLQVAGVDLGTLQVSDAIKFELARRSFEAGRYTIGYQVCDDSSLPQGFFTPAACRRNAHTYAGSALVLAVIGPYNSGCAEQELPILNRSRNGPVAAISGSATNLGLTRAGPGAAAGEPARLYPTGVRSFARVIANDGVQGAADALLAKQLGSKRIYILNDNFSLYGPGVAAAARTAARKLGLKVVGYESWNYSAKNFIGLAQRIKRSRADSVFLGGTFDANGDVLLRDLRAVLGDRVRIIAPDAFSGPGVVEQTGQAAEGMYTSVTAAPNDRLPPAGRQFVAEFGKAIGRSVAPYSVTYAQAADVLLNAIARSNGTRASVTTQLFKTKVSNGILGSFSFDHNGDTTAGTVTIYRTVRGNPIVFKVITLPRWLLRG